MPKNIFLTVLFILSLSFALPSYAVSGTAESIYPPDPYAVVHSVQMNGQPAKPGIDNFKVFETVSDFPTAPVYKTDPQTYVIGVV